MSATNAESNTSAIIGMRLLLGNLLFFLLLSFVVVACDDDGGSSGQDTDDVSDVSSDLPDGEADTGMDVTADGDLSSDQQDADGQDSDTGDDTDMGGPTCQFPEPRFGSGTVVDSPGHCGLDFQWVSPDTMGDFGEAGTEQSLQAVVLGALLTGADIEVPRQPEHDVTVKQFTYVTQDRGTALEASALVAFPTTLQPDEPVPVIAILHGTAGFTDACSPSNEADGLALPAYFASLGYIAVAPDYIGMKGLGEPTGFKHPYLVGQPTAISVLDSIRAVGKLGPDELGGVCPSARTVILGGSQGGHAALWVDRLAPYYAPEIELAGMVATVPPADLVGQIDRALNSYVNATGNTVAFYGAAADWYGLEERLDEMFLPPLDTEIPMALATDCSPGDLIDDTVNGLEDIFQQSFLDDVAANGITGVEPWACMTERNGLTTTPVPRLEQPADEYAVLYLLGENDDLVNTPIERTAFDTLCANDEMPLQFLECAGAGHVDATLWALPEILTFLEARLAGEVPLAADLCERSAPVMCQGTP